MPLETSTAILRGHAAVSTSARRPGGRFDRGRATGLPVAPIRLRRRERADGSRTPTDFRQDPRTRNDVQDADESLASWTRHRIGVRQRHRRRITGAPARFACPFLDPLRTSTRCRSTSISIARPRTLRGRSGRSARYSCRFSRVAASAGAVKANFLPGSGFRERPDAPHLIFRT